MKTALEIIKIQLLSEIEELVDEIEVLPEEAFESMKVTKIDMLSTAQKARDAIRFALEGMK